MFYLLICSVILLIIILYLLMANKQATYQAYYQGRGDGWVACENLACERINKSFDEDKAHHIAMTLFQ